MNAKKEINLGFTKLIKQYNYDSESEEEEEFPTKIGGQPIWMNKNNIPEQVICKNCDQSMIFLLQLFSPLGFKQAYHRTIYVFQCVSKQCMDKSQQIRVLRTQLPKEEKLSFHTTEGKFTKFLEKQYKIISDIETKKEAQTIHLMAQEKINTFNLGDNELKQIQQQTNKNNNNNSSDKKDKTEQEKDFDKEFAMAKEYAMTMIKQKEAEEKNNKSRKSSTSSNIDEDSDDEEDEKRKDKAFTQYEMFINQIGEHSVRFCRDKNSEPLYFSDKNQWNKEDVEKCAHCGSKRIFEFQINNCLLNLYPELIAQDWGIAVIYTCENSCEVKNSSYVEEFAKLQVGTEDPLTLEEIHQGIEKMKKETEEYDRQELLKEQAEQNGEEQQTQQQQEELKEEEQIIQNKKSENDNDDGNDEDDENQEQQQQKQLSEEEIAKQEEKKKKRNEAKKAKKVQKQQQQEDGNNEQNNNDDEW